MLPKWMLWTLVVAHIFAACIKRVNQESEVGGFVSIQEDPPTNEWEQEPPLPSAPKTASGRLPRKNDLVIASGTKLPMEVVHVVDGDTVTVSTRTKPARVFKVRLAGINAPECHKERRRTSRKVSAACVSDDEGHGLAAYSFLKKTLSAAKSVEMTCKTLPHSSICEKDRYGRLLATLWGDGEDVNRKMVEEGMAMAFTKYPHEERASYCKAEFDARRARRGMWALAPTVDQVLALMSQKTRQWYRQHDDLCQSAIRAEDGKKGK